MLHDEGLGRKGVTIAIFAELSKQEGGTMGKGL